MSVRKAAEDDGDRVGGPGRGVVRRLLVNASILGGGKTLNGLFSLAYTAVAVRALGIEEFGVLILIHTCAQTIGEICKFQSWQAVLRYGTPAIQDDRKGDFQKLLKFTLILDAVSSACGVLLGVVAVWLMGPILGWPAHMGPAAMAYMTSIAFMVTATPTGLLRLFDRFDLLASRSAAGSLARLVGALLAYAAGGGLTAFLLVWFSATVVSGVVLFHSAWREVSRRGFLEGMDRGLRGLTDPHPQIWRFVLTTNANTTLSVTTTHVGTLVVGAMLGPAEAALYRIARQMAEAAAKPTNLLGPAIYPEFSRLASEGAPRRLLALLLRALALAGAGASLFLLALGLFGDEALRIVMGEEASAAYGVMILLGVASLVAVGASPLEPFLISVGAAGNALRARLLATVAYLPSLPLLILLDGLSGVGLAAIGAALVSLAAQSVAVVRWFGSARPAENPL